MAESHMNRTYLLLSLIALLVGPAAAGAVFTLND